jgi:hypothetical protein
MTRRARRDAARRPVSVPDPADAACWHVIAEAWAPGWSLPRGWHRLGRAW